METAMSIKTRIIEKMADIDAGKSRWVAVIVFFGMIFLIALGVWATPAAEYGTQTGESYDLTLNEHRVERFEAVAIPGLYTMTFEVEMDHSPGMENNWVYAYLYKDEPPEISTDTVEGDLRPYLLSKAYLAQPLSFGAHSIEWVIPYQDSDTTTFYIVFYNPQNLENPYQGDKTRVSVTTSYEPTLPLVPITFLLVLVIIPLGIIRVYVLNQRKKELRIQLSLDLENLSDEDKVRLGIPVEPVQAQGPPPHM